MRILIIEDDRELAEAMRIRLEREDFAVDVCHDGEDGLYYMREKIHDLVILDRMLPLLNGAKLLRQARKEQIFVPVIFLTALGTLDDKVTGLDCGADDYMVKPFEFPELLARIRSILRRPGKWDDSALLRLGDVSFDPAVGRLCSKSGECTLSRRETSLMELFLRNPGQILTRDTLLLRVWGLDSDVEDGNLDNYIHFLRRRLKSVQSSLNLRTVRGVGYQMEVFR